MTTIIGTEGDDDGVAAPALQSPGWASTIQGLDGDDLPTSGSRLFDTTPDVLVGDDGDDAYVVPIPVIHPICSTPIIWARSEGDVEFREAISATDRDGLLVLSEAFRAGNTTMAFDGHVGTDSFACTLRDPASLQDVGTATIAVAAPPGALPGTAAGNAMTGTVAGETILAQGSDDRVEAGLGNHDAWGGRGTSGLAVAAARTRCAAARGTTGGRAMAAPTSSSAAPASTP